MSDESSERSAELSRLLDLVDRAYAEARAQVFDLEEPGADPGLRTPRQRRLVDRLEGLEAEVHAFRDRFWGSAR